MNAQKTPVRAVLWDVDGTLLDFLAAERAALRACFKKHNLGECTDEMIARYSLINKAFWERLESGELTKPQVLVGRYEEFFAREGIRADAAAVNDDYQALLGETVVFMDDSYALLASLRGRVKNYAVTNGTRVAQRMKLAKSGFDTLLDGVFISDEIGHEKPTAAFFDHVFSVIPESRAETLIVGDSLTSDIRGGNNAGLRACWYNPRREKNTKGVRVDYEIDDLRRIVAILDEND